MSKFIKRFFTKNNQTSTDDIDGGVTKRYDSKAPKKISCTKPIFFECAFSTLASMEVKEIGRSVFALTAKLKDGIVSASYKSRMEKFSFETEPSFMEELQSIISEYDFAQFNGSYYHVSGLPDMYGATISVKYESGEAIYADNNQDCFIPLEAIEKLVALFKKRK